MIKIGTRVISWMVWISGLSFYKIYDTTFNSNQFDILEARQVLGAQHLSLEHSNKTKLIIFRIFIQNLCKSPKHCSPESEKT